MKTATLLLIVAGVAVAGFVVYTKNKSGKTPLRTIAKQPGTPTGSTSPLAGAQQYVTAGQSLITASENLLSSLAGNSGPTTVTHPAAPPASSQTSSVATDDGTDSTDLGSMDDGSDYAPDDGLQD